MRDKIKFNDEPATSRELSLIDYIIASMDDLTLNNPSPILPPGSFYYIDLWTDSNPMLIIRIGVPILYNTKITDIESFRRAYMEARMTQETR